MDGPLIMNWQVQTRHRYVDKESTSLSLSLSLSHTCTHTHTHIHTHTHTVLVDPGRLTISLVPGGPTDEVTAASEPMRLACGVLTVTVRSSPPEQKTMKKGIIMQS